MTQQTLTPELLAWLDDSMRAGHSGMTLFESMLSSGWDAGAAAQALAQAGLALSATPHLPLEVPHIGTGDQGRVWAHDKEVHICLQMAAPRLTVLSGLLSAPECAALMDLAAPRLSRSETVASTADGTEVNPARTSQGMFFGRGENELCQRIEARIAALTGWPIERGEGLQILRYPPGAQYQAHYDYFEPDQPSSAAILKRGGQRLATLVMYLNTPQAGGATTFPDMGLSVQAQAGGAVFFAYPDPSPSSLTLHGGAPVLAGEKWVATKWFRQSRFD